MSNSIRSRVRPATTGLLLVWMLVGIAACGPVRSMPGGRSGTVVTRSQILSVTDGTAVSFLRMLRPRWLDARIQATPANPTPVYARVYLDDLFYGEIDCLYNIPSNSIERIEYLGSLDATTRYGTGHMGGVIKVTTR